MTRIGIDARMYGSSFTGIGKHVFQLLREFAKKMENEKDITIVVFCAPENTPEIRALSPGFEAVPVNIPHYSLREQFLYPQILRKAKLDLMHFPHFNAPIGYR